jgi:hypothetical protein
MTIPEERMRHRARRAYEVARLKIGVIRALLLAALVGVVAFVSFHDTAVAWLAITVVAWSVLEWRGGAVLRGGRVGAGVGFAALAIPLWAFRTCCRAGDAMMGADCCNMTSTCGFVGVLLGLTLAVFLVRAPRAHRVESAIGMGVALLAVASVRCAGLVTGESLGLLGGLAAGALASSLVVGVVGRARAAS